MMRSICFPVDARWIKNPDNNPLATMSARMGAAARTRLCIETIGLVLSAHFSKPGRHFTGADLMTRPNKWTVRLVRISMGTVDPITGGASMKAVQDAVARWCEVPNERDPIWTWVEPIKQEKRGYVKGADGSRRAWTGVRIELEDLAPGESKPIELATIEGYIARAKANLKARESLKPKKTKKDKTMARGTQVYHADKGERAASSSARSKAEAAFAKVTGRAGKPAEARLPKSEKARPNKGERAVTPAGSEDATPRMLEPCQVHGVARGIVCPGEPSGACVHRRRLAGLASAAARVLAPTKPTGPRKVATTLTDEQAAMRAQARTVACAACGRDAGFECWDLSNHDRQSSLDFEYGVHTARARAAGLPAYPCGHDLNAGARPVRVICDRCRAGLISETGALCGTCKGSIGVGWTWLPGRGAEVWLVLPWHVRPCGCVRTILDQREPWTSADPACKACNGTGRKPLYTRATDVRDPPPQRLTFAVPVDLIAAHGRAVTLTRTTITTRAGRLAWLFTKEGSERT